MGSRSNKMRTSHLWHDSRGGEREAGVIVEYTFHRGYPATWEEPGCPDHVEVQSVISIDSNVEIWSEIDLDAFADECLADWHDRATEAAERRAEQRRDDLMMEKF